MVVTDEHLEANYPGTNNPVLCWDCLIPWADEEFYGGGYLDSMMMESSDRYETEEEQESKRRR